MKYFKTIKILDHLVRIKLEKITDSYTIGITNECEDGFFIPFLDYDKIKYKVLKRNVKMLQNNFGLSDALVLCSSEPEEIEDDVFGNFHVVFFDKMFYHDCLDILRCTPTDQLSRILHKFTWYKTWVLRISEKKDAKTDEIISTRPEPYCVIRSNKKSKNNLSEAHFEFYKQRYEKDYHFVQYDGNWDGLSKVFILEYPTNKKKDAKVKGRWLEVE